MAQWGNIDNAANSCLWAVAGFKKNANSTNRTAFFGNTTAAAYIADKTVGLFGADATETTVANGSLLSFTVTFTGSGYLANTTVTVSGNGTANATSNSTGKISAVTVIANGTNYSSNPTVTIAAPTAVLFNGNTAVGATNAFISLSATNHPWIVNDVVTYSVASGNTVISPLTNNASYFILLANNKGIQLKSSLGNSTEISIGRSPLTDGAGQKLTGQTATVEAVLAKADAGFHAGWVVRTVGSGGRAGPVQYETQVAIGSMTSANEDAVLKDL